MIPIKGWICSERKGLDVTWTNAGMEFEVLLLAREAECETEQRTVDPRAVDYKISLRLRPEAPV